MKQMLIQLEKQFEMKKKTNLPPKIDIDFVLKKNFIYHVENIKRLCISISCEQTIFELIHDQNNHAEHHRIYHVLMTTIFIFKFSRKFCQYIKHCSSCEFNQIKQYFIYEKLMLIKKSTISFRIIVMNFILTLSEKLNVMLTVTCKAFKRMALISEKST